MVNAPCWSLARNALSSFQASFIKITVSMTTRTLARMAGMVERLVIPAADDFHVHLRQGAMMQTVVPHVRQGGCQRVYVMV